jgi:hypothetical protein
MTESSIIEEKNAKGKVRTSNKLFPPSSLIEDDRFIILGRTENNKHYSQFFDTQKILALTEEDEDLLSKPELSFYIDGVCNSV